MAAVLITIQDGTVDYVTEGAVKVVLVDLDRYDMERGFPDDVEADLVKLRKLPSNMAWNPQLMTQLVEIRDELRRRIRTNE